MPSDVSTAEFARPGGPPLSMRLLRGFRDCESLAGDWDRILAEQQSEGISSLGITSSYEWAKVLSQTRLQGKDQPVVVLERGGQTAGLLPLYFSRRPVHGVRCRVLAPFSEIYGGRDGFILSAARVEDLERLFDYLRRELAGWDAFLFTVVEGSTSAALALAVSERGKFGCRSIWSNRSPYIALGPSWIAFFGRLPKQFRHNLRAAEKKMASSGTPDYEEFVDGPGAACFLEAVLDIERHSWKEREGTSITGNPHQRQVYERLAEVATSKGWFSGHLLRLNGEPIAYIYALLADGVFYHLKSSFKAQYREFSPGNLLTRYALERLHEYGARFYDFKGDCEAYKMRWTEGTYICRTYAIYNRTPGGQLTRFAGSLRRATRRRPPQAG